MIRRAVALVLAGMLVVASTACDRILGELGEGDLSIDNRTDTTLTILLMGENADGSMGGSYLTDVSPGSLRGINKMDGCFAVGLEAHDPDGEVVARLPPLDPDEHDCRFTWVITEDDSFIEQ